MLLSTRGDGAFDAVFEWERTPTGRRVLVNSPAMAEARRLAAERAPAGLPAVAAAAVRPAVRPAAGAFCLL